MKTLNKYVLKDNDLYLFDGQEGKPYVLKLKDMRTDDKPREKLLKYGAAALSLQELMAIVLGTGTTKEDVLEMSSRVIKEYGARSLSSHINPKTMSTDLKIPLVKAIIISACAELGRRFFEKNQMGLATIRTAKDAFQYVQDMKNLPKEHLRGIYLNTQHRVIHDEIISIGTINSNIIHPREVFKPAIEYGAAGIILVHNHPSGNVEPSKMDIDITEQLIKAGKLIGISLIDHLVVAGDQFLSIKADY